MANITVICPTSSNPDFAKVVFSSNLTRGCLKVFTLPKASRGGEGKTAVKR